MNRVVTMVRTEHVALRRFDHVPHVAHCDPERERADGHAISFVESGGASVTDACFTSGFGSLSHVVTAFRRRYGVRPSRIQS